MSKDTNHGTGNGRSFEWWMISFIAAGVGWSAFISLLIPPFVTEATGNAADAGIVMAVISLSAVLAPVNIGLTALFSVWACLGWPSVF